jgi:hypothetical protein
MKPRLALGICWSLRPVPAQLELAGAVPMTLRRCDWALRLRARAGTPMPTRRDHSAAPRIRVSIRGPVRKGLGGNDFPPPDPPPQPVRLEFALCYGEVGGRLMRAAGAGIRGISPSCPEATQPHGVTPAQAGVQPDSAPQPMSAPMALGMGSGLRRNDIRDGRRAPCPPPTTLRVVPPLHGGRET